MRTDDTIPQITLIGPPNSGKTTLFNILSGKNHKTVNYPGSTVEYYTSRILSKYQLKALLLDSPGLISLIPESIDENITVQSLYNSSKPGTYQIIIVTVDASQLSRHLLLPMQLLKSGFKIIIALTMNDILQKRNAKVSEEKLSKELNCPVVKINGKTKDGIAELIDTVGFSLDKIKNNGYSEPIPYDKIIHSSSLIDIFLEIENITNSVMQYSPQSTQPDFKNANDQLKVYPDLPFGDNFRADNLTLKLDRILLHRYWGIFIFILVMGTAFTSIFWLAQPLMDLVDSFFSNLNNLVLENLEPGWFSDILAEGLISGTGSVLVFVPQIIILFIVLGLLEDSGYLARGAMLVDKPLSKIGLNGRSFVPMLSGFACAIPAMLAARTIPNRKERLLTIFIIPLMSCSARLPVYALLISYLVPKDKLWLGGFLLAAIYLFSITVSVIIAAIINKFRKQLFRADDMSSFILELPAYRLPKISSVLISTYNSSKEYILRAGPIILLFSIILWFLVYFPGADSKSEIQELSKTEMISFEKSERLENSYAASLGKFIEPVMAPIGMDWRVGVSLISTFAAREVFVSSLALTFKVTTDDGESQVNLLNSLRSATIGSSEQKVFTTATILGLIVFFVFALQCMSTLAVSRKETGGWRIPIIQVLFFTTIAYVFTLITVNGLRILGVE